MGCYKVIRASYKCLMLVLAILLNSTCASRTRVSREGCKKSLSIMKMRYYRVEMLAQNGSSDQPFPIIFSKNKNDMYVQKVAFLANFEKIFEKFQSVAKL